MKLSRTVVVFFAGALVGVLAMNLRGWTSRSATGADVQRVGNHVFVFSSLPEGYLRSSYIEGFVGGASEAAGGRYGGITCGNVDYHRAIDRGREDGAAVAAMLDRGQISAGAELLGVLRTFERVHLLATAMMDESLAVLDPTAGAQDRYSRERRANESPAESAERLKALRLVADQELDYLQREVRDLVGAASFGPDGAVSD